MERVLGLRRPRSQFVPPCSTSAIARRGRARRGLGREERSARGAAVHALLEWSQANGWREPTAELARRHAARRRARPASSTDAEALLGPVRGWLGSPLLRERDRAARDAGSGPRCRSCSASAAPSCAARSTCWSSATARRRWSSTTRPTASTARTRRARRPLRDPALDLRPRRRRGARRRRGRGRLRLPRARRRPGPTVLDRPRWPPAAPASSRPIEQISAASSSRRSRTRAHLGLCRGCPALGDSCTGPPSSD